MNYASVKSAHVGAVLCCAFEHGTCAVATGGADGAVCVWRQHSLRPVVTLRHPESVHCVLFVPPSTSTNTAAATITPTKATTTTTTATTTTPSGGGGAGGGAGASTSTNTTASPPPPPPPPASTTTSTYCPWLVSGSKDGIVRVWAAAARSQVKPVPAVSFQAHTATVSCAALASSGALLATASTNGSIKLWDFPASTGCSPNLVLRGHSDRVFAVQFSPDSLLAVSCSKDRTARVWVVATGACLRVLRHRNYVSGCAWSPDGQLLATGCFDNTVCLFPTAGLRDAKPPREVLHGHSSPVYVVQFGVHGTLVSSSKDGSVAIWDVAQRKVLSTLHNASAVMSLALSADGKYAALGGADGSLRLMGNLPRASSGALQELRGKVAVLEGAMTRLLGHAVDAVPVSDRVQELEATVKRLGRQQHRLVQEIRRWRNRAMKSERRLARVTGVVEDLEGGAAAANSSDSDLDRSEATDGENSSDSD